MTRPDRRWSPVFRDHLSGSLEDFSGVMVPRSQLVLKALLFILYYTGIARAFAPLAGGRGVIFMLHRVGPVEDAGFAPNRILKITPHFLDAVIRLVKRLGYDIISLDDVPKRLHNKQSRRFACFTLDDGYRDNIDHAYPVFKQHNVPFTIYLPTQFADGRGELWWLVLQESILKASQITVSIDGGFETLATKTTQQKTDVFDRLYWRLRAMPEKDARRIVQGLAEQTGYDATPLCSDLVMTWDEARDLAADPLVAFGGHTCRHLALAKLPVDEAKQEILESITRLGRELDQPVKHFAYPYGDEGSAGSREFQLAEEAGLETAVTTRKGLIYTTHKDALTGLPRVSLNGDYQDIRFVSVFLTGVPLVLWSGLSVVKHAIKAARDHIRGRRAPTPVGDSGLQGTSPSRA